MEANESVYPCGDIQPEYGLTKREYFAAMAMQGLLTNYVAHGMYGNHESFPLVEEMAVSCADRLINELNLPIK